MSQQNSIVRRFGEFRLDAGRRLLFKNAALVALPPKAFEILRFLVESGGQLVEKTELMREIWQDSFVEDNNLTVNMTLIRRALGEKRGENRFIATIPGRGYRFVADVFEDEAAEDFPVIEEITTTDVFIGEEFSETAAESVVNPPISASLPPARKTDFFARHRLPVAALILTILLGGVVYFALTPRRIENPAQIQTLAVLPFKPLAMNEQDAIFGMGMADAVIAKLSRIKRVAVRPTSAIVKYAAQNKDLTTVGTELNVEALLDGKIQRNGDKLRVSVQLIRVSDNAPLWTKTFDAKESDVFALQDSISEQVADSLALKLNDTERRQIGKHPTDNPEAYKLYLNGIYQLNKRSIASVKLAISYFEQALEEQPDYALAYAGLGDAYVMIGNQEALLGALSASENMPKAKSALTKALNLDESLAEAHSSMAWVSIWETGDIVISIKDLNRALELNPNLALAHNYNGLLKMCRSEFDEALLEMRKAQRIDQFSLIYNLNIATVLFRARRYGEAAAQARKTLELDPNFARAYWLLGLIYEQEENFPEAVSALGRAVEISGGGTLAKAALAHAYAKSGNRAEAEKRLGALLAESHEKYVAPDSIAMIYAALGNREKAFFHLERAVAERPFSMFQLGIEQRFDEIRRDPRFRKIQSAVEKGR